MYKIKEKFIATVAKYAMKTNLDIRGVYSKETWNEAGFMDIILEEVK